ncbi:MAG: hypothetical protein HYU36_25035 [Planctomycetes bacterium]|nr:hypothetical protein [Planctomycetota bacterium]
MHIVSDDLKLEKLVVYYPGEGRFPLADGIEALPFRQCPEILAEMG